MSYRPRRDFDWLWVGAILCGIAILGAAVVMHIINGGGRP